MLKRIVVYLLFIISFSGCSKFNNDTLFSKQESDDTGIKFVNKVVNGPKMNLFKYRNFYNGGGVAIGDINNDGLSDVYFTSNQGSNKLYLNKGDFKFQDISKSFSAIVNAPIGPALP